jgi:LppX_LprAFG lipoprotein
MSLRKLTTARGARGRRMLPVLFGAFGLLIVLAGCGAAGSPSAGPLTAQQIFDHAKNSKMKDATVAMTGSGNTSVTGQQVDMTITANGQLVTKPEAAHIQMSMQMNGQAFSGTITLDEIVVNGKSYTKTAVQIPGLPTPNSDKYTVTTDTSLASSFQAQNLSNLKLSGEETIRGDKCWHLTGTAGASASTAGSATPSTSAPVDVWVREADYYLVRVKSSVLPGGAGLFGGTASSTTDASSSFSLTMDFSKFDSGVTIQAPSADQIGA